MTEPGRLSNYPFVRVRVRCARCRRYGDLSLARLAQKLGAEASLWDVMKHLTADCVRRRRGSLYQPCYAQLIDIENGRPPDLPPGYRVLRVLDGGRAGEPCGEAGEDRSSGDVRTRGSDPAA